MITDYVLAACCFVFAIRLRRAVPPPSIPASMWTLALVATGVAAVFGGTYHGFYDAWSTWPARLLWTTAMLAIGVASFGVAVGAAASELSPRALRPVFRLLVLKLVLYVVMIVVRPLFGVAVVDYGSVALAVGILAAVSYARHRRSTAGWLLVAIVVALAAAAVLLVPFGKHGYGDERDVYHIIQIVSMYALYRAGLAAGQREL